MSRQDDQSHGPSTGGNPGPARLRNLALDSHWYVAGAVAHQVPSAPPSARLNVRDYWFLLTADDSRSAREKSVALGARAVGRSTTGAKGEWHLDGLSELLLVAEPPSNGSELMWVSQELTAEEISAFVRPKHELQVFLNPAQLTNADWYICTVVLVEVHETGTHGESALVWMNSHLLRAPDDESAFTEAMALGSDSASESGSHRCNGDVARWEFRGLRDLRRTAEPPTDGALLWIEQCESTADELARRIPAPHDLSVFEWERRSSAGT